MYLPFDFRLEKTPGGTPATGHYLRTVTLEIRTDDLRQIAKSEEVTTMANSVRYEEHAVRTALGCGTRDVIPGGKMIVCFANQCGYCRSEIVAGQRWVREKIYDPALNGCDPSYHRYHSELFAGQEISCWEKHQMEQEIVRSTAYAA